MTNHETDRRAQWASALWEAAEQNTIAEWICCDPIDPKHGLCVTGGKALEMLRALIVDDPEAYKPAPLTTVALELAAVSVPPPARRADDRAAVCICGHTEAQHFEDACVTEVTGCDCGDFLTGAAAREVIARWRDAAIQARTDRAAVLREAETEAERQLATVQRVRHVLELEPVLNRTALEYRGLIISALMADEAQPQPVAGEQQPETPEATPCSVPNPCDPDDGPCDRHEREQSHAENDHSVCRRDECEVLRQS